MSVSNMKLFLLFCMIHVGDFQFSLNTLVGVTVSVMNHHHSTCVYLLHSGRIQGSASFLYLKTLTTRGNFSVATVPMDTNLKLLEVSSCQGNSPLYVLLSNDATAQKYLEQVTLKSLLSTGRWLMFFSAPSIEIFFSNIKIPYDCEFFVTQPLINKDKREDGLSLIEIYQDHPSRSLQKHLVALWTISGGLNWSAPLLIQRRANLHGISIRVGLIPEDYTAAVERKCSGDTRSAFCEVEYEIWSALQKKLNFTSVFDMPEDENCIYNINNISWSCPIAKVLLDQVDIIVKKGGMTPSRISHMAFTSTPFSIKIATYIKKQVSNNSNWRLISLPFSYGFWWVISALLIVFIFLLSITWYVSSPHGTHQRGENFNIYNSLLYVFGIFCQQGHDTSPQSWPCRLVYITAYLTFVTLFIAYSAIFIAILSVNHYKLPFVDFKGLLDSGTYRFIMPGQPVYIELFEEATDPVLNTIYSRLIAPNVKTFPKTEIDCLQQVCAQNRYAATVDSYDARYNNDRLTCKLLAVPRANFRLPASFIVNKNSSYTRLFSYYVERLRSSGILQKLQDNALPITTRDSEESHTQATLGEILPILIILVTGFLVSIICLLAEVFIFRLRNHFRKQHINCSIRFLR